MVAPVAFLCMFAPLAVRTHLVASSHPFAAATRRVSIAGGARQHHPRRWTTSTAAFASTSSGSSRRPTSAAPSITRRCRQPLTDRIMTPPHSTLAMSAVEETPSPASSAETAAPPKTTAKRVSATASSLQQCGARLRAGNLVSFPTETVYGLGCHALDPAAVQKVFDAKERPLSDPLIVHVTRSEDALDLWDASSSAASPGGTPDEEATAHAVEARRIERQALKTLTQTFFPGPLTLVARAHPAVPQILMANTGYVACRSPSHPVARALIDAAQCPIAAPSANKFGHVSPTLAEHVMDDLGREDVWVVDPTLGVEAGGEGAETEEAGQVCRVGVESTVAKIEMHADPSSANENDIKGSITILRHGAVSSQSIREALAAAHLLRHFDVADSIHFTSEKIQNVAPGQTVKHYSPNVPCFLVGVARQGHATSEGQLNDAERDILSQSVIIDYGKRLAQYRTHALAYRDLSPEGMASDAASTVFETLRWSETIEGAKRVFVPEIVLEKDGETDEEGRALGLAVKDKLTRAASAVIVEAFR